MQLLILGQMCQIESENKILHKFIDMTTENFNVELKKSHNVVELERCI